MLSAHTHAPARARGGAGGEVESRSRLVAVAGAQAKKGCEPTRVLASASSALFLRTRESARRELQPYGGAAFLAASGGVADRIGNHATSPSLSVLRTFGLGRGAVGRARRGSWLRVSIVTYLGRRVRGLGGLGGVLRC
jgi:hypothetical protein